MMKFNDQNVELSKQLKARLIEEVGQAAAEYQDAVQAFDEAAARYLGTNLTDLRCMGALFRRGAVTAGQLAEIGGITAGAITAALDRLERAGYARRVRDTADRRRVLVELTPQARRLIDQLWGPLATESQAELHQRTNEELLLVRDVLRHNRTIQLAHARRVLNLPAPARRRDAIG